MLTLYLIFIDFVNHFDEFFFKFGILAFHLKGEFAGSRILPETDISEIVLVIKLLEIFHNILVCLLLISYAAVLSVNYKDDALPKDIVMTQHIINLRLLLPVTL